jgi:ankyrin repeat protein
MKLSLSKEIFNGTGEKHYSEFLGKPFYITTPMQPNKPDGWITPEYLLRMAAGWGVLEAIISIFCDHELDINSQDLNGETALLKAARAGHVEIVEWLIHTAGARADISTKTGVTPLHWIGSFPKHEIKRLTRLLHGARGNPDAVMIEDFDAIEGNYWFFRGPPLMRVVASGNLEAVEALLGVGANPRVSRDNTRENPIIFAARRLRLDIFKALLQKAGVEIVWDIDNSAYSLVADIIACNANYAAKIHNTNFRQAQIETFDYVWSLAESPARQFRSIDADGNIAIMAAVGEGHMNIVKRIVETCPTTGYLQQLVITIGMQAAILSGRYEIFQYLLEKGAQPLHPVLRPKPGAPTQFDDYVTCGPWTVDLAAHQRKTTSLHLCAQAGNLSHLFCRKLLERILPPSRWERTPETLRTEGHIDCACQVLPQDDPIVDCRNEQDETPLFVALKAEEYQMAFVLFEAGANKNTLILHPVITTQGQFGYNNEPGLPLAELALTWISAERALFFLISACWGCLRLTNTYGDELRLGVIEETARWTKSEAAVVFKYVQESAYEGFVWDRQIVIAIKCMNEAAVEHLLNHQDLIPAHRSPHDLYDAVRSTLVNNFKKNGAPPSGDQPEQKLLWLRERAEVTARATKLVRLIRNKYPNHPIGGSELPGFVRQAMCEHILELLNLARRYEQGLIGLHKLSAEINRMLEPWLMVMPTVLAQDDLELIRAFLQSPLEKFANIQFDQENRRIILRNATSTTHSLGSLLTIGARKDQRSDLASGKRLSTWKNLVLRRK